MQEPLDLFLHCSWYVDVSFHTRDSQFNVTYSGCYIALGNYEKAQELLDAVPAAMEKKKISGKDLPTEVFIKKKRGCIYHNTGLSDN
jgi:hypothetical protein